jgi:glutamate 5-kinase
MNAKIDAGIIVTHFGADMVLASGQDISVLYDILEGENVGTLFKANINEAFDLESFL